MISNVRSTKGDENLHILFFLELKMNESMVMRWIGKL